MNTSVLDARTCAAPPPTSPPITPPIRRFTLDGGSALENRLRLTCERIRGALCGLLPADRLEGILLGGGYGRGEGGVLKLADGEHPYNDLEFYVFLRGNRHLNELRHGRALHVLGEILTPQAGVEVEFKITSLEEFRGAPVSMFSYDLVSGHRRLHGSPELLVGCEHHAIAEHIPLVEASRLLMNRCSGLLFSRERLSRKQPTSQDIDFVRRNLAKAALAFGDAVLTAHGLYHWSCRERHHRLQELPPDPSLRCLYDIRRQHKVGVAFKLHPERINGNRDQLEFQLTVLTALGLQLWLWIESQRLDVPFRTVDDYLDHPADKCPGTPALRNFLVNAKAVGPVSALLHTPFRHPRERVFEALALLLWKPDVVATTAGRRFLESKIGVCGETFSDQIAAYRALWSRVN